MSEHFCKNCINSNGDPNSPVCKHTGAVHTTGIECPSFELRTDQETPKNGRGK